MLLGSVEVRFRLAPFSLTLIKQCERIVRRPVIRKQLARLEEAPLRFTEISPPLTRTAQTVPRARVAGILLHDRAICLEAFLQFPGFSKRFGKPESRRPVWANPKGRTKCWNGLFVPALRDS